MLALSGTQALEASATTAATVTYTVMGCTTNTAAPPVAQNYEVLAQGQIASSAGSLYTPGAGNDALISSVQLMNTSATAVQTVNVYIDGTAAANQVTSLQIPAGGSASYEDGTGWTVLTSTGVPASGTGIPAEAGVSVASQTSALTTAANLTNVAFNIGANQTWTFDAQVLVSASSTTTTGGAKLAVTAPVGATGFYIVSGTVASAATTASETSTAVLGTLLGPFCETTSGQVVSVEGVIVNGNTAGSVSVQMAAVTTAVTVTAAAGSNIVAFEV